MRRRPWLCCLLLLMWPMNSFEADAEELDTAWQKQAERLAPPKIQVREYLKKGIYELKEDPDGAAKARFRLNKILQDWQNEPPAKLSGSVDGSIHKAGVRANLREDFFTQAHYFWLLQALQERGELPAELLEASYAVAQEGLHPMERGPNNRPYHFAVGHAAAAKLYPQAPEAKRWRAYAEAVWNDFAEPGDTYEPGYVEHNMLPLLDLAYLLDKEKELTSPHLTPYFERVRRNVSPSGLVIDPGDGAGQDAYPEWLARYAALSQDGTFLWAAERVIEAGRYGGYRDKYRARPKAAEAQAEKERLLSQLYKQGVKPKVPETTSEVLSIYPQTFRIPDRLILNASRAPGHPFAAFYLNDTAETLQHANEDNRGDLYHYEVDGIMMLKRSSWQKWAAQTNTFIVSDAEIEFPWQEKPGLPKGHWFRGSANIRPIRLNQPTEEWQLDVEASDALPHLNVKLLDVKEGLGYRWDNPRGFSGEHDVIPLHEVTLSFNTFTGSMTGKHGEKMTFPASVGWYRDYRDNAPAQGPVVVRIRDLQLSGPVGDKMLAKFNQIPQNLKVVYYPAGKPGTLHPPAEVIPQKRWQDFLRVVEDKAAGGLVVEVTCPPGRLDLTLTGLGLKFDVTKEYPRLDLDYAYQSGADAFLRAPIGIYLDGLRFRSLYLDHQQGGVLQEADVEMQGKDCYGIMAYSGVYTSDSAWNRQAVLTEEGYLVVVDTFLPGPRAGGMLAGPVWQLTSQAKALPGGFAAPVDIPAKQNLYVALFGPEGSKLGQQRQEKLWKLVEHAVYRQAKLKSGEPARFVSVMLPYQGEIPSSQLSQKVAFLPAKDGKKETIVTIQGKKAEVLIHLTPQAWKVVRK